MDDRPRLIEVAFPLKQASLDSVHEKNVRHGHISTLHIWTARRPLAACRAALIATLLPDPGTPEARKALLEKIGGKVVTRVERKKPTRSEAIPTPIAGIERPRYAAMKKAEATPELPTEIKKQIKTATQKLQEKLRESQKKAEEMGLKDTDVLILPDLRGYSSASFDQAPNLIPVGEKAARAIAGKCAWQQSATGLKRWRPTISDMTSWRAMHCAAYCAAC